MVHLKTLIYKVSNGFGVWSVRENERRSESERERERESTREWERVQGDLCVCGPKPANNTNNHQSLVLIGLEPN